MEEDFFNSENNVGKTDDVQDAKEAFKQLPSSKISISDGEIEKWLFEPQPFASKICCLLYGVDDTGKSGIVMEYLSKEDIKNGYKMLIIDLDGGCGNIFAEYHRDKSDNIIIKNPLDTGIDDDGQVITDYKKVLNRIKSVVRWCSKNYKEYKIKAIVFDGLSTLLSHAEFIMRVERNIQADGGVSQRYWIVRMRIFTEIMEQIKALPMARFFIAHEDFIATPEKELSAAKRKTNAMVFQKIKCERFDVPGQVVFKATIDKAKGNTKLEGSTIEFCKVDKDTGEVVWKGRDVLDKFLE